MDLDLKKIFTLACRERKKHPPKSEVARILTEEYDDLSKRVCRSGLQDGALIRGNLRARRLAFALFTPEGKLDLERVNEAIKVLKRHTYFLGPKRCDDALRQEHLIRALKHLAESPATQRLLMQFSRPDGHLIGEKVIKETLDYPDSHSLTDRDVRIAVLSAWLCFLRQSVGSCFATAPALIIQTEQPDQLLIDLKDLMETGRMKRVAAGHEIHAPLSASWGVGDFRKPVAIPVGNHEAYKEIGLSPGLMAALEAAGVIDPALPLKDRVALTMEKTDAALSLSHSGGLYFAATAEGILKAILLQHFDLSETLYQDWLNRPREMVFGNLMMAMPHSERGQKGVGLKASKIMQGLQAGKSAFMRLAENALLKTWEFTLASFSETKGEFSTWNLYVSLGLSPDEKGGIGEALYHEVKERLEATNRKVEGYQAEYEALYSQLKFAEGRMKSVETEKELRWLRAEYQSRLNEFTTFEAMRNKEHFRAKRLATLFSDVIDRYIALFPRYFQEVYDAEVHEAARGFWDDRPAGFRLLFKHGRVNTAQWTRIDSPDSFSEALASFFSLTESELSYSNEFEGLEQDISLLVTRAIQQVKTKEFLESSLWRMAKKHHAPLIKNPLDHLDEIDKKPWAYTSGGNLNTLVASYFKLTEGPKSADRFVESEIELIVFLADVLKQIPYEVTDVFKKDPSKRMLMHSPTHAFNLMPGLYPFNLTWDEDLFTYTAIRDQFVHPAQHFWEKTVITQEVYERLIERLVKRIPENFKPGFRNAFALFPGEMSPPDLAGYILDKFEVDPALKNRQGVLIDSVELAELFMKWLPYISNAQLTEEGAQVFKGLPEIEKLWPSFLKRLNEEGLFADELIEALLGLYVEISKETSSGKDLEYEVSRRLRDKGWLPPMPLLFADTNWPGYFFSMLVSPATGKFELWRTDRLGLTGAPMEAWKSWLDGSRHQPKWGVLCNPREYRM